MKDEIILQDNYEKINDNNVKLYEKYGLNSSIDYTCTICGRQVTVDGSISYKGHDLMCCRCVQNVFGSYNWAFKYLEERNVKG